MVSCEMTGSPLYYLVIPYGLTSSARRAVLGRTPSHFLGLASQVVVWEMTGSSLDLLNVVHWFSGSFQIIQVVLTDLDRGYAVSQLGIN